MCTFGRAVDIYVDNLNCIPRYICKLLYVHTDSRLKYTLVYAHKHYRLDYTYCRQVAWRFRGMTENRSGVVSRNSDFSLTNVYHCCSRKFRERIQALRLVGDSGTQRSLIRRTLSCAHEEQRDIKRALRVRLFLTQGFSSRRSGK